MLHTEGSVLSSECVSAAVSLLYLWMGRLVSYSSHCSHYFLGQLSLGSSQSMYTEQAGGHQHLRGQWSSPHIHTTDRLFCLCDLRPRILLKPFTFCHLLLMKTRTEKGSSPRVTDGGASCGETGEKADGG